MPVSIFPYFNRMNPHSKHEIKPGRKKAEQMRNMRNIRTTAQELASQFNQCINEYHNRRRNRNNPPEQEYRTRENYRISKKQGINRATRSKQINIILPGKLIHKEGEKSAQCSTQKIKKQKFTASYSLFKTCSEYHKCQHVKQDMPEIIMHEHISYKLPVHMIISDGNRSHYTIC